MSSCFSEMDLLAEFSDYSLRLQLNNKNHYNLKGMGALSRSLTRSLSLPNPLWAAYMATNELNATRGCPWRILPVENQCGKESPRLVQFSIWWFKFQLFIRALEFSFHVLNFMYSKNPKPKPPLICPSFFLPSIGNYLSSVSDHRRERSL